MNDSKELILNTSLQLFLQKGFKEVTMKEIVDKTALSKGAFYHYFSSKEQVFSEVIDHFMKDAMVTSYHLLPQATLKDFYHSMLDQMERSMNATAKLVEKDKDNTFNNNFYYLIFDAMRLLPAFKERVLESQKEELRTWKRVIGTAKQKGEIKTEISDDQLAKIFIYAGDGMTINQVMGDNTKSAPKKNELKALWTAIYDQVKV